MTTLIALGFLRDFVFVNINYYLKYLSGYTTKNHAHYFTQFLEPFSYQTIYKGKFILTVAFTLVYLLITQLIIHLLYQNKKFRTYTNLTFSIIFVLALFLYGLSQFCGFPQLGYVLSRRLMGFVQSPIVLMLLIPFYWGITHQKIKI